MTTSVNSKGHVIDTNIIIRFLICDDKSQLEKIEKYFKDASDSSILVPSLVLAESVYVLLSVYNLSKEDIVNKLLTFIRFEKFKIDRKLIVAALNIYLNTNISFVDAYICALQYRNKVSKVITFDKAILKLDYIESSNP